MAVPNNDDPPVIAARGLRKSFGGVEVLHGVDIEARAGRVLALLGENGAGKSTTVKILVGDYRADAGQIHIDGQPTRIETPADGEAAGVRVIYQEFMDAPDLTVAENILLGHWPTSRGVVRWSEIRRRAGEVIDELGVNMDLDAEVGTLGVAERQIVEIARSLVNEARVLILDEPTSALAAEEVESLFSFVRRLRDQGVAIIYITHRLDEVEEIGDDILIFRDGHVVAHGEVAEFDRQAIVHAMVGEELKEEIEEFRATAAGERESEVALSIRGASIRGTVSDVDVDVHRGEIVALFGRLGCGATELAEAVFGVRPLDAGHMALNGQRLHPRSPADAIDAGIGFVPVDRKTQGLLTGLSVSENLAVSRWGRGAALSLVRPSGVAEAFGRWQDTLSIRAPQGAQQPIDTLSGGNQQKVMLGRWLERAAEVLVLAEPTRGVDVGARAEIYRVLHELAGDGAAILVVSSDLDEVLRIADRVVVFSRGKVSGEYRRSDGLDRPTLVHAAAMK